MIRLTKLLLTSLTLLVLSACGGGGSDATIPPPLTYSISGTVSGDVLQDVTITLSGATSLTTTTDASGNYSFTGLLNGSYNVSPSLTEYNFNPLSTNVTINETNVTNVNFTASAVVVIPLDTSVIRAYQQGDTFTATLYMREILSGQIVSGDVTLTIGAIVPNPYGIDCRSAIYAGTLTGLGGTVAYSVKTLFYQDVNNSIYECGEFNDTLGDYVFLTDTATSPNGIFLETKSPMQIGDSTSGVVFLDDGTWQDCTGTVLAKENVSTPLGLYESYKTALSCSYSDGTTLVSTIWTVPSINDLKETGTMDGVAVELLIQSYKLI